MLMRLITQEVGSQERPQCNAIWEENDTWFDQEKEKQSKGQEDKGLQERYKERLGGGEEGGAWEREGEQKFDWEEAGGVRGTKEKGKSNTGAPGD